jgi:hypothetical protein
MKYIRLLSLALLGVACSAPTPTPLTSSAAAITPRPPAPLPTATPLGPHTHVEPTQVNLELQVSLVASELVVGPNRFAVGLQDATGKLLHNAAVHFHYFDLSKPDAPALESEADATRITTPDGFTTIYTHEREFKRAGNWGVEVQARFPDGKAAIKRIAFTVLADSPTLKVGKKAPSLKTPTAADVKNDYKLLTSATMPTPAFYQLSLDQALTNGKPTIALLATPAFCQTRFCGPAYEIVTQVQKRYADRANFIHVEVFQGLPNPATTNFKLAPIMDAFGLRTEPWVFVIDGNGIVFARLEGVFTLAEVERQVRAVLGM